VLRRIFGSKREEVEGGWSLRNEELHNLYTSPNIIAVIISSRLRWVGHEARMGEKRNAYNILVGKREGKKSLGKPSRGWEGNIITDRT